MLFDEFQKMNKRALAEASRKGTHPTEANAVAKCPPEIHYKIKEYYVEETDSSCWVAVPRESYIKSMVTPLLNQLKHEFKIRPYCGQKRDEDSYEGDDSEDESSELNDFYGDWISEALKQSDDDISEVDSDDFNRVHDLPIFSPHNPVPPMKNGRVTQDNCIHRAYVVTDGGPKPQGAVYFVIDPVTLDCEIKLLGISPAKQQNGMGSTLLEVALFVTALYGCDTINLQTSKEGMPLYLKHGFFFDCPNNGWRTYNRNTEKKILSLLSITGSLELDIKDPARLAALQSQFQNNFQFTGQISDILHSHCLKVKMLNENAQHVAKQLAILNAHQVKNTHYRQKADNDAQALAETLKIPQSFWGNYKLESPKNNDNDARQNTVNPAKRNKFGGS